MQTTRETTENLDCRLTPSELTKAARRLAQRTMELKSIEAKKKDINADFKGKIDEAKAEIALLSRTIDTEVESRSVKCLETIDERIMKVRLVRLDTNELVRERDLSDFEKGQVEARRQGDLPLVSIPQRPGMRITIDANDADDLDEETEEEIRRRAKACEAVVHEKDGALVIEPVPRGDVFTKFTAWLKAEVEVAFGVESNGVGEEDAPDEGDTTEARMRKATELGSQYGHETDLGDAWDDEWREKLVEDMGGTITDEEENAAGDAFEKALQSRTETAAQKAKKGRAKK